MKKIIFIIIVGFSFVHCASLRGPASVDSENKNSSPLEGKKLIAKEDIVLNSVMVNVHLVLIQKGHVMKEQRDYDFLDSDTPAMGTTFCTLELPPGQSIGAVLIKKGQELLLTDGDSNGAMGYVYKAQSSSPISNFNCFSISKNPQKDLNRSTIQKEITHVFSIE